MHKLKVYFKNTFLVLSAEYFYYGVLFLIGILISRSFGDKEFGNFNLVISVAQICILTLGSAFSIILRRDMALNESVGNDLLHKTIILRIITILISLVAGAIFITGVYNAHFVLILSFIFITLYRGFDLLNESFFIFYQAQKRIEKYFVAKILLSIFLLLSFYIIIKAVPLNFNLSYAVLAITSCLVFSVQFIPYYRNQQKHSSKSNIRSTYRYILTEAWPMIANSFFFQVNSRLSILLIGYLCFNSGYVGLYAAAISIVSAITMVGNGIAIVLFSKLAELFSTNIKAFQILLYKICGSIFILGVAAGLLYFLLTPLFIKMYKLTDISSAQVFLWCGISIPFIMINTILGYVFSIARKQKTALIISIINLFLSLIIIFAFTKMNQIIGASQAYLITNILYFIILGIALQLIIKMAKNSQPINKMV